MVLDCSGYWERDGRIHTGMIGSSILSKLLHQRARSIVSSTIKCSALAEGSFLQNYLEIPCLALLAIQYGVRDGTEIIEITTPHK